MTTDRSVTHATFTLERLHPAAAARVFAVWAEPKAKTRWFSTPEADHELDFRVGGREVNRSRPDSDPSLTFEALHRDIVPDERIVYTSVPYAGDDLATASLTDRAVLPGRWGHPAVPHRAGHLPRRPGGAFLAGGSAPATGSTRCEPSWVREGRGEPAAVPSEVEGAGAAGHGVLSAGVRLLLNQGTGDGGCEPAGQSDQGTEDDGDGQ
ncbi:SRPBCC domain-containing protein [Streptomyces uncialis]|uniref:SRPBCC domain-containing protein n=1 Tax=Streptomyces uncialis TaxID=1048205 RepID=UPI0037FF1712